MLLIEIAVYILFITLILFFSTRVLWLFFLLFCYRFWESILTLEKLSKYIDFKQPRDYYIVLIIISVITYFIVLAATQTIPVLQYILLTIMALYVLRHYELRDVLVFKDYFEARGMWNIDYWVGQVKNLFTADKSVFMDIFDSVAKSIGNLFRRMQAYVQGL